VLRVYSSVLQDKCRGKGKGWDTNRAEQAFSKPTSVTYDTFVTGIYLPVATRRQTLPLRSPKVNNEDVCCVIRKMCAFHKFIA
jgi:hypothetical protein